MPELTPQSTPPPPAATPPRIPPESWESFPAFRESFLLYFWTRRSETEPVNARKVIHPQP